MKVRDIMTSDPFVVTQNDPLWRAAEIMRDIDVGLATNVGPLSPHKIEEVLQQVSAPRRVPVA